MKNATASELVPIRAIERNAIVMKSGGLRALLLVSGMNFELRSDEEQNAALMGYQALMNGLDFPIQIFMRSRKVNIDAYAAELEAIGMHEENDLLKSLVAGYRTFVMELVAQNPIMEKRIFVAVPYDPYGSDFGIAAQGIIERFFGKKKPVGSESNAGEDAFAQLEARTDAIAAGLTQIGLRAVRLEDGELAELFTSLYDPQTATRHIMPEAA